MGKFTLLQDLAEGIAKKAAGSAKPFYSAADKAALEIPRTKGTGAEFMRELEKTKGVKPAEIQHRKLEEIKSMPKMTKEEFVKEVQGRKPAQVEEKVLREPTQDELMEQAERLMEEDARIHAESIYGKVTARNNSDWYDEYQSELDRLKRTETDKYLDQASEDMPFGATRFNKPDLVLPGGENYREILLKLPEKKNAPVNAGKSAATMLFERDMMAKYGGDTFPSVYGKLNGGEIDKYEMLVREDRNSAKTESILQDKRNNYRSTHWPDDTNVVAHMRVSDRTGPNGEKVLHVEEIQSDWHQAGRKRGYKKSEEELAAEKKRLLKEHNEYVIAESNELNNELKQVNEQLRSIPFGQQTEEALKLKAREDSIHRQLRILSESTPSAPKNEGVPDAPFKKNWHELAMKRVLDYAAENGYDTVAITPGAEQAKRYDLSKQVDKIVWNEKTGDLAAQRSGGDTGTIKYSGVTREKLADYIGKEPAQKILDAEDFSGWRSIEGNDLKVGGEGMKGFYDKILPDYLNTYGKQYGTGVGQIDLITKPEQAIPQIAAPGIGHFPEPVIEPAQMLKAHSFDITPQMREAIKTKGQPLYSAMGPEGLAAGTSAATIGAEALQGDDEQRVQNPVHFTENPDAMHLELMQRN